MSFGRITPRIADSRDRNAVELGFKFRPLVNGWVTGIRFYKAARNTGRHVASLWTTDGHLLASATFRDESRSGWQSVAFASPVRVRRRTTYVAGYFAPRGHYAIRKRGAKSAVTRGRVGAIRSVRNGNGLYTYASHSTFPSSTYAGAIFYIDVDFTGPGGVTSSPGATTTTSGSNSGSNSATPSPPADLPAGVTTQAVDGGSNYYCSNGFTYACKGGWDDPSFFPIIDDYAFYPNNSPSSFKSIGMNTSVRVTSDPDMSLLRKADIFAIPGTGTNDSASDYGSETVGGHIEEPGSWSDITSQANSENSEFGITGRFFQPSFTWNQFVFGGISATPCGNTMQATMTCTTGMPDGRHLDIPTADVYWFAGSTTKPGDPTDFGGVCAGFYGLSGDCSQAQIAEASHYGDMVDQMREWVNGGKTDGTPGNDPNAPYIETDDGLVGHDSRPINPPELQWADWDTIIHGARMLIYFGNTSDDGTGGNGRFGFSDKPQSGFSVSDATQATDTHALVESIAPILNSPFARGYASGSNGGYTFPTPDPRIGSGDELDLMVKDYTGGSFSNSSGTFGNGFYVFVTGRGPETQTNIPVTLTLPSSVPDGPVKAIDASTGAPSSRTLSVSRAQISFTLPHAYDTYIIGPIAR